jgi:hypothetical protein
VIKTSSLFGNSRVQPFVSLVKAVPLPFTTFPFTSMILPYPLTAKSCGLSTGMAPVPRIIGPIKVRLHDLAAAMKLIGLLTTFMSS